MRNGAPLVAMALLPLFAGVLPRAARASGPELFGFGVRSPAMAGTGVAFADDFEAVYANPAGLVEARRRLTLGYVAAAWHLGIDGKPHGNDDTTALLLGADLPLPLGGILRDRLAIGLGFQLPTNVVNRARVPFAGTDMMLLDNRTQTVSVMAALSLRLPANLSLGGGVIALAALLGGIDLVGMPGGRFGARSEQQLVASYAPLVGLRWRPLPSLRVGLAYRGESMSRYDIEVRNDLGGALPFDLPTLRFAGVSQFDPRSLAAEVALGRARSAASETRWLAALQLQWQRWSGMPPLVEPVTPGSPAPAAPGLRDTVNVRLGLEYALPQPDLPITTTLRAGYAFLLTPVADAAPTRTLHDASRHVASLGLALHSTSPRVPLRLDLFYQLNLLGGGPRAEGWFGVLGFTLGADL